MSLWTPGEEAPLYASLPASTGTSGSYNTHAVLAPSSAKRWCHCTASVAYCEENSLLVREGDTRWADEGSRAHDEAEAVLSGRKNIADVPEDFRPHVTFYVNHCLPFAAAASFTLVEEKVPLFYSPEDTGTVDFAAISMRRIVIRDLKYGAGVMVDAKENEQLGIYALSLIESLEADGLISFDPDTEVDIGIVQPRYRGEDPVRTWVVTLQELRDFLAPVQAAADLILSGGPTAFAPSEDACRWCKAKGFCEARRQWSLAPLDAETLAAVPTLTKAEVKLPAEERVALRLPGTNMATLVAFWANKSNITALLDDVAELLRQTLPPGVKLVQGREGNRAWADEAAAEKLLASKLKLDERTTRKLISPTQAESLLQNFLDSPRFAAKFGALVVRPEGKPTLALEDDKRSAISNSFADL